MRACGPFSCTPTGSVWGFRGRQGQAAARWPTASLDPLSTPTRSTGFCGPGRAGEGDCWGRAAGRFVATAGSCAGGLAKPTQVRPSTSCGVSGTPTAQSGFARERALEREAWNGRQRSGVLDGGLGQDRPEAGNVRADGGPNPWKGALKANPAGAGFAVRQDRSRSSVSKNSATASATSAETGGGGGGGFSSSGTGSTTRSGRARSTSAATFPPFPWRTRFTATAPADRAGTRTARPPPSGPP